MELLRRWRVRICPSWPPGVVLTAIFLRSYSGYGKVGFDRRFRMYEISDYGETIRTWKHTEHNDMLNLQILTGSGAAPPYEEPAR